MAHETNTVSISGNLGRDPEIKETGNGLATFSLAVNRFIPRGNEQFDKQTSWFRCVAWGAVAEAVSQQLHKGCRVQVQGRLEAHNWTDKNGQMKTGVEIVVQSFNLIAESKSRQDDDPPIGNQAQGQQLQLAGVGAGKKSSSRKSRKAV